METTPAYLAGEIDDPSLSAPPPPKIGHMHVLMRVELPSERALTSMFRGLIRGIDLSLSEDEIARLLAQRLPIGLAQLEDVLPDPVEWPDRRETAAVERSVAKRRREPQS